MVRVGPQITGRDGPQITERDSPQITGRDCPQIKEIVHRLLRFTQITILFNYPINQSPIHLFNQLTNQPFNQSPINHSTKQPINQSTIQPINQSTNHQSTNIDCHFFYCVIHRDQIAIIIPA